MSKKEVAFIINPIAGTKSKEAFEQLIRINLDGKKFSSFISYTREQGHAYELASHAVKKGTDYIVAVGGDGTVNETARALLYEENALGIIPFGSGNGLARHLGIPLNPSLAIQTINSEHSRLIDGGKANGKPFFCTAGIGFDAHVGRLFALSSKRGFSTYVKTVLKEFLNYKTLHYKVSFDNAGVLEKKAFSVTFANAGQFGNNAYISPLADISDGKLDLCFIEKYPKRVGWHLGLRLFNKSMHKSRFASIYKIDEAVVDCPDAQCFHLDGESLSLNGPLTVSVMPSCLRILTPR